MKKIGVLFLFCVCNNTLWSMESKKTKRLSVSKLVRTLRRSTSFTSSKDKKQTSISFTHENPQNTPPRSPKSFYSSVIEGLNNNAGSITPEQINEWRKERDFRFWMSQDDEEEAPQKNKSKKENV